MRFTRRARPFPAALAIVLVVAAAASVSAFGRATHPALEPASAPCTNSAKAEAAIAAVWKQSEAILGVPQLKPPAQTLCYVDTSKSKKSGPTIAFASQGPTNSWASSSDAYVRYVAHRTRSSSRTHRRTVTRRSRSATSRTCSHRTRTRC